MKVLISRTDRIGDVILSLPLAEILKEHHPDSEIYYLLADTTKELVKNHPSVDKVIILNGHGFTGNVTKLKDEHFDIVLLLFPTFSLSLMFFLAGIPKRVGTGYRWYSFLLNQKQYEHRRPSEKHELEYNIDLLKRLGIHTTTRKPRLYISPDERESAKQFLKNNGVTKNHFIVVHHGSGGSTLTWPLDHFKNLVVQLTEHTDYAIVLTGTKEERETAEYIKEGIEGSIMNISGKTDLRQLISIISLASMFIGNSTGPMHIAAAVDTPVVAFFPPSRVNRKTRWGPLCDSLIFEPPVPPCRRCIEERCPHYNCLSLISPDEVAEKIETWRT
jgi:heptosyltransferase-3